MYASSQNLNNSLCTTYDLPSEHNSRDCSNGASGVMHSVRDLSTGPQMKYLVSVTGHLGRKFSDYIWVLCQKLHI